MTQQRLLIAAYVENKYGVLTRITGLFMRRGFNIDSLSVGETEDPAYSRITISLRGDVYVREQLISQLAKLHNVKKVKLLEGASTVQRDLMLVKVKNRQETRSDVMAAADVYRARIIGYTTDTLCMEVTGEPSKLEAFLEIMQPIGVVEMSRAGVVALERNNSILDA